jgi:hypothetical protein
VDDTLLFPSINLPHQTLDKLLEAICDLIKAPKDESNLYPMAELLSAMKYDWGFAVTEESYNNFEKNHVMGMADHYCIIFIYIAALPLPLAQTFREKWQAGKRPRQESLESKLHSEERGAKRVKIGTIDISSWKIMVADPYHVLPRGKKGFLTVYPGLDYSQLNEESNVNFYCGLGETQPGRAVVIKDCYEGHADVYVQKSNLGPKKIEIMFGNEPLEENEREFFERLCSCNMTRLRADVAHWQRGNPDGVTEEECLDYLKCKLMKKMKRCSKELKIKNAPNVRNRAIATARVVLDEIKRK